MSSSGSESFVYPDGEGVQYTYNTRGMLKSVPGIVEELTYDPAGKKTTMACANGVSTIYTHDPRTRLRSIETLSPVEGRGDCTLWR